MLILVFSPFNLMKVQMFLLALSLWCFADTYFKNTNIKEEFLFCFALETNTKIFDAMEKKLEFFKCENLKWENLFSACSDGTPSILGAKSGFQTLKENLSPKVLTVYCMMHRHLLQISHLVVLYRMIT